MMKFKKIIHDSLSLICWNIGPTHRTEKKLVKLYYTDTETIKPQERTVVFMIDGREKHGGMADRFRSICTIYRWCKDHHINFKLNYVSPFRLEDYLLPNEVDWICHDSLVYDENFSKPVVMFDYLLPMKYHEKYLNLQWKWSRKTLHLYTYSFFNIQTYGEDFRELFRPTEKLQMEINFHISQIGCPYIAVVTRFQQLLGDFEEGNFKILDEKSRSNLIDSCIHKIRDIYQKDQRKILCTSDSSTFLQKVDKLDFVYTIPGKIVHIDYNSNASYDTYLKSFVDFYMIGHAEYTHLLLTGDMYRSGFPGAAAQAFGHPWDIIEFDTKNEKIIKG